MSCLEFGRYEKNLIGCAAELGLAGPSSSFTVSCWFFITAFNPVDQNNDTGDNTILGMDCISDGCTLHLITRDRKLYFGFFFNDTEGTTTLEDHQWYHAAFVYDAFAKIQRIYLNGILDGEGTNKPPLAGNFPVILSSYFGERGLNGRLANLRIWTAPLTEKAIRTAMLCTEEVDFQNDPRISVYSDQSISYRFPGCFVDESIGEAMSRAAEIVGLDCWPRKYVFKRPET